jgi:hypothetical protein
VGDILPIVLEKVHYLLPVRRETLDFRMEVKGLRRWAVTAAR